MVAKYLLDIPYFAKYIIKDIKERIFFSKVFKATFMLEAYWTVFQTKFCIHDGQIMWIKKAKGDQWQINTKGKKAWSKQ